MKPTDAFFEVKSSFGAVGKLKLRFRLRREGADLTTRNSDHISHEEGK
jgi:hypothetical protein